MTLCELCWEAPTHELCRYHLSITHAEGGKLVCMPELRTCHNVIKGWALIIIHQQSDNVSWEHLPQ